MVTWFRWRRHSFLKKKCLCLWEHVEVEFSETRIYHQQTSPTTEIADIQVAILVCVQYWWAGVARASLLPLFFMQYWWAVAASVPMLSLFLVSWGCQCRTVASVFVRNIGELVLSVPHFCLCFVRSIGELVLPVPHSCLCFCTQYWWAGVASASLLSLFCTQYWWAGAASAALLPLFLYAILVSCRCQSPNVAPVFVRNIGELELLVP